MKKTNFLFKIIFPGLMLISFSAKAADDISVIDVRRNITLSDSETVYRDYYLNAGESTALRKNMIINVKRKINVKDTSTKTIGEFEAVVGQLKIIQIGNKVSVAREYKLIPRDEEPMLEQTGIMTGDRLDLAGSYIDNAKPVQKKKTSEAQPPAKEKEEETKTAEAVEIPQI